MKQFMADASVVIQEPASIGKAMLRRGVTVGPFTVIEDDVEVGVNTDIGSSCFIGEGAFIGTGCKISTNTYVAPGVQIGDGVFVDPCCVVVANVVAGNRVIRRVK